MRRHEIQQLLARFILGCKGKVNIGAVKTFQKDLTITTRKQSLYNLITGFPVSRGRERGQGNVQRIPQRADTQVIRPEVMAPLTDTMGFVHRNHRHACTA